MAHDYAYTFPALRGIQAGKPYYVAMCPLKLIPRLFLFDEEELPPALRAQRVLNKARIPEMARYLLENESDYVFSAITASIDGDIEFESASAGTNGDVGQIIVPMTCRLVINDGQHRRAAIEAALQDRPELGDETIAVVFFVDKDLKRSQQLFADLNKYAFRPTKALSILYDSRDPLAALARDLAEGVPLFKDLVEKEKTTISNRSIKLFTLNAIYQATQELLDKKKHEEVSRAERELAFGFWTVLGEAIPEWRLAARREVSSAELRRKYVHSHSVALHAIGIAGAALIQQIPNDWKARLEKLASLDWSRRNPVWEGRAMSGGQMSKSRQNVQLTANLLKTTMKLSLSPKERQLENGFRSANRVDKPNLPSIET